MKRPCIILGILVAIALCNTIAFASNEIQPRHHLKDTAELSHSGRLASDDGYSAMLLAQARSPQNRPQPRDPEKLNEMIAWRFIKYLDLNEEQSEKFIPMFKESNKNRGSLMRKKDELVDKLAADVDNNSISTQELQKQLGEIQKLNQALVDEHATFLRKMGSILSERQAIKLEIFEDKFRIDLSRRLDETNRRRRETDRND